jgi:hypothetical protein
MTPELPDELTGSTENRSSTSTRITKEQKERLIEEFGVTLQKHLAEQRPSPSIVTESAELPRPRWKTRMPFVAAYFMSAVLLLLPLCLLVAFLTTRGFNATGFYFGLLLFALIFHFLWRTLISPLNGFLLARREAVSKPSNSMVLMNFLWLLCQTYFLLGWCAFAEQFTRIHSGLPNVSQHWAYWLWGFMLCATPVSDTFDQTKNNNFWIAGASFVVFAFWPAATAPWAWFLVPILRFTGLQTS